MGRGAITWEKDRDAGAIMQALHLGFCQGFSLRVGEVGSRMA